nr:AsmA-like C-terminal region-containing protein [Kineobactrum salinum]
MSQDLGIERDISGSLNLRGGLSAQGITTGELVAQLNGSVGLALEDATVEGAAYDVLATSLLTWLFSGAALEESTQIQCTMARFALVDGVARSDDIYAESERMIATGEGEFDLVNRTLAMTLTPRSRSRAIQIPSKITLRGDMASPRVTVSPVTTTLNISTEVLLFLPRMVMKLLGLNRGRSDGGRECVVQPIQ